MNRNAIVVLCCLLASIALAQPPAGEGGGRPPMRPPKWSLGIGTFYANEVYEGVDEEMWPIPFVAYRGERLSVMGPFASYKLAEPGKLTVSVVAGYDFSGYDADDSDIFDGMDDRDGTVMAGLKLEYELSGDFALELKASSDVLGRHDGLTGSLELGRSVAKGRGTWIIKPTAGVNWQSSKHADYYYGVGDSEETDERSAYDVDQVVNWTIGCNVIYNHTPKVSVMFMPGLEWLDDKITDSPLVDEDLLFKAMLAVTYAL